MNPPLVRFLAVVAFSLGFFSVAQAVQYSFAASLDGPSEAPPNASPGTGSVLLLYDDTAHTLQVVASFVDLLAGVTAAHIHGPTALPGVGNAGVATTTPTFLGFPSGVTAGSYDATLDLTLASSYRAAFITSSGGTTAGAEAVLVTALFDGTAYFNIHSTAYPGGEIRGFLSQVPDVGTTALMLVVSLGAMVGVMRYQRINRA